MHSVTFGKIAGHKKKKRVKSENVGYVPFQIKNILGTYRKNKKKLQQTLM